GSAVGGVVCGIRACRRPLLVRDDRTRRRELCGAARRGDAAGAAGDRMTAPATPATPRRLTRRGTTLILAALGAALVITVLLAPEDVALRGPGGTSTYDDSPTGARLLYLLVGRLRWPARPIRRRSKRCWRRRSRSAPRMRTCCSTAFGRAPGCCTSPAGGTAWPTRSISRAPTPARSAQVYQYHHVMMFIRLLEYHFGRATW